LRSLPATIHSAKLTARAFPQYVGPEPEGANIEDQGFGGRTSLERLWWGHHRQRPGVIWTTTPTSGATTSSQPVQSTNGADEESGRCASVDTEEWRWQRHGAGCARSVQAAFASMLTTDLACGSTLLTKRFHGASTSIRMSWQTRLRGVVQADTSRHGADRALSRSARSEGTTGVADPVPAVDHKWLGRRTLLL